MLKLLTSLHRFFFKYKEALYVTNHQYRLKFVRHRQSKQGKTLLVFQVTNKRAKIEFELSQFASNKQILDELHPVDAARVAFLASLESGNAIDKAPGFITAQYSSPVIHEQPALLISAQTLNQSNNETLFSLKSKQSEIKNTFSALELMQKDDLLYGLGSEAALSIGYAAGADFLRDQKNLEEKPYTTSANNQKQLSYYHVICMLYVALALSGISIIKRIFPFHIPFTDAVVPMGAGVIFFPLTFAIQDITTEVYGFARSRQMIWLSIVMIVIYIGYTQLAIHLPSGQGLLYQSNASYSTVFNSLPRQLFALVVSMLTGVLLNDFLISRLKVVYGGKYLWARIFFSTLIGEAVLNVIGVIVGFAGTLHFNTQLLPNMGLSYAYKLIWNASLIPVIYIITDFLKKKEGIDVYDYDTNYNPFILRS